MGAIVYHTHSKETTPPALIYTKENINRLGLVGINDKLQQIMTYLSAFVTR